MGDWTNPLTRFQRYLQGMGTGLQQGVQNFLAPRSTQPQSIGERTISPDLWNAWENVGQFLPQGETSLGVAGKPVTPELIEALKAYAAKNPGRVQNFPGMGKELPSAASVQPPPGNIRSSIEDMIMFGGTPENIPGAVGGTGDLYLEPMVPNALGIPERSSGIVSQGENPAGLRKEWIPKDAPKYNPKYKNPMKEKK